MILLLGIPAPIALALERGLQAEGETVAIDPDDLSSMKDVRRRVVERRPRALVVTGGLEDPAACEADPDRAFRDNAENVIHATEAYAAYLRPGAGEAA